MHTLSILQALLFASSLFLPDCVQAQVCKADNNDICTAESTLDTTDVYASIGALIQWIRDEGGFFHPKLEVRAFPIEQPEDDEEEQDEDETDQANADEEEDDEDDKQGFSFGLYVKENEIISKGEQLMYFPETTVISLAVKASLDMDNACWLADEVGTERNHHTLKNSSFAPYMEFLETYIVDHVNLPASWSADARAVLHRIVEQEFFASFAPYYRCFLFDVTGDGAENSFVMEGYENFGDPEFWDENLELALSRRRNNMLAPIYDLIQHSNDPQKINIVTDFKNHEEGEFSVNAARDLSSGEQIRHSYGLGTPFFNHWFGFVDYGQGTLDMIRDYGFVEPYPQRWYYAEHSLDFSIRKVDDGTEGNDDDQEEPNLELVWLTDNIPDDDALYTMDRQLDDLNDIKDEIEAWATLDSKSTLLNTASAFEIKTLYKFLLAYIKSVEMVYEASIELRGADQSEFSLQEETITIDNVDNHMFQVYQCNTMIQKVFRNEFEKIETLQSTYQTIDYYKDPETNDRCLYLDNVYQQCISYWPHYHELVVHKPAKYLKEDLKRVLWVGGGDSGPLNEILKYPNLELAVGLELDQQVTRLAFKHFASRPHYDNPKVQWWYGDASKSLLMLPKEYFGSFDLVIVDLSDTVFSLSVSAELDVIEAISLLLRPGGIFEMNELFFRKVSNVFEYAVHYNFQDVPKILDQAAIFASNDVDFMYQEMTDHKLVENATLLVEKASMKTRDQFDRIHDYRHNPNPAFKKLCRKMEEGEKEAKPQTDAPGIMMIIEAENLSADLSSPTAVRTSVMESIEEVGLTVVSDKSETMSSSRFVIMLKEGYVVVRLYADVKYCALDIHLWSAFDSHDALKDEIVIKALGGSLKNKATSSYRIVAGGMFGLPNWKETSATHGPQILQVCSKDEVPKRDGPSDISVYKQALEMSLDVVGGKDLTVAVLCNATAAENDPNDCPSLAVVKRHPNVKQVIRLIPCLLDEDHGVPDNLIEEAIMNCSMTWADEILEEELSEDKDVIDMIVLDPAVSEDFTDVLNLMDVEKHITPEKFFIFGTVDKRNELWRRKLVDNVRFGYVKIDPVFRAQILFNTTTSSLEVSVASAGDYLFIERLTKAVAASQEKSKDVTLEIRNIIGGLFRTMKQEECLDEDFSHVTVAEDYNNEDATSQWNSQTPVATQTVARFVNEVDGKPVVLEDPEQLIRAFQSVLGAQNANSIKIYSAEEGAGGDGLVCTGTWATGTAVLSWDGRSQVDFNIWSDTNYAEVLALEKKMVAQVDKSLMEGLRDFQPRGYGRVVNFEQDLKGKDTFFNQK